MRFKQPAVTVLTLMLVAAAIPCVSAAQEEAGGTLYVEVSCMKSTSADYVDVETEIWQPIHQQAVKQGKQAGWAVYWVLHGDRSVCDYYTVNTYRGLEQLNAAGDPSEYFAAAHPGKNWDEAWQRTVASRDHVRSQLWVWLDGVPGGDHRFMAVNQMYAEDGPAYVQFEQETWKPIHQALVEGGHSAGWGLYALSSPHGSSIPYNYGTVDLMKQLGPVPIAEAIGSAHPDADVAAILQQGLDLRDHVLGETWMLIASTE
jgi:hypothetical protein